jgi:hypothetical protein
VSKPSACPACGHLPSRGCHAEPHVRFEDSGTGARIPKWVDAVLVNCKCPCHAQADALVAAVLEWKRINPHCPTQIRSAGELVRLVQEALSAYPVPTASDAKEQP